MAAMELVMFDDRDTIPRCIAWVPCAPALYSALTFSHISRRLREIALSTAALWSAPLSTKHLSLAELALQRAAS
jgi:hypothetical protein